MGNKCDTKQDDENCMRWAVDTLYPLFTGRMRASLSQWLQLAHMRRSLPLWSKKRNVTSTLLRILEKEEVALL
jgi:hypothetical protein